MLLVHSIDKLELQDPLACDGLDAGKKSRNLDDTLAAHLFERVVWSRVSRRQQLGQRKWIMFIITDKGKADRESVL